MPRNLTGRIATGGLIVLVGVLLLLATTGTVPSDSIWEFVPAIFVLLGLWALVSSGFRNLTGPVMVIAIAGTYLARNLDLIGDDAIGTWWPLFLVLFGVFLLLGRERRSHGHVEVDEADGQLTAIAVFGGAERRVTTDRFVGGEVVVAFGGAEIDLRDAGIDRPPATLETIVLFGGADVVVPEDWNVSLDVLPLFGGASDERPRPSRDAERPAESGGGPDLVVTGVALFGGVEVK